jgi:GTP-binding protein EngB required for normal cell division
VSSRTLTYTQWLKLVRQHALEPTWENISGYPVVDVAHRLDVSDKRVYQLVDAGTLDTIVITNKLGKVCMTLVTEASLNRYLAKRVPVPGHQGYFTFPETA